MVELADADNAIVVRGLRKTFGDIIALDGVTLSVRKSEVFGLVGPDGAGKTTLMRLLCGLQPPDEGEMFVAGCDVVADPEAAKPLIGYLPQRFGLWGDLTVKENIRFSADIFDVPPEAYKERMEELLRITRLAPFVNRYAEHLSGGMKQKLALICTLIHRPQVLLLDEPTTGVDPASRRDFWQLLHTLPAEGVTILVSTPYMDEAERCDRVSLLHEGRIRVCATVAELKSRVKGTLFSMGATPQARAKEVLEGREDVMAVAVFGDRLHVTAREEASLEVLVDALKNAGLDVAFAEAIEPGMEDAFTAAIRQGGEWIG